MLTSSPHCAAVSASASSTSYVSSARSAARSAQHSDTDVDSCTAHAQYSLQAHGQVI